LNSVTIEIFSAETKRIIFSHEKIELFLSYNEVMLLIDFYPLKNLIKISGGVTNWCFPWTSERNNPNPGT